MNSLQFWAHVFFCALGAAILYNQWGRSELRAYSLSTYLDTIDFSDDRIRDRVEMIAFIVVGTMIAMGVGHPSTVPQAFAAGAGFTGLVAKPHSESSKRKNASKRQIQKV